LLRNARTSEVLAALAAHSTERLTVGDVVLILRDRAFALLVVLLGLPNCLPMPPPIPLVCGLLLALVAAQIVAGRDALGCRAPSCAARSRAPSWCGRLIGRFRAEAPGTLVRGRAGRRWAPPSACVCSASSSWRWRSASSWPRP
jgi:hypothetical protein